MGSFETLKSTGSVQFGQIRAEVKITGIKVDCVSRSFFAPLVKLPKQRHLDEFENIHVKFDQPCSGSVKSVNSEEQNKPIRIFLRPKGTNRPDF